MPQKNKISLEGKMDDWGPFERNEGKWLIFSIGNPEEGHGYALPRNIDDLFSQHVAHLISCKTGGRYVAHIPWTTDPFDPIAKDWSPKFIPIKELVKNLKEFLKYHLKIYNKMNLPASCVFILSGHGGNEPLSSYTEEIKRELGLEKFIISKSEDLAENKMKEIIQGVEELSLHLTSKGGNSKKMARTLITILTSAGHADHFEHSIAATLGVLDEEKLKIMNENLEKDFNAALDKWPPIGGFGGFLMRGGKYIDAFGTKDNTKYSFWNCLKSLRKLDQGKIKVVKELGELVINLLVEYYSELLLDKLP